MSKRCSGCKRDLDFELFGRNKRTKDGYACYCRECVTAVNREQYEKNRERRKGEARLYRQENAEAISQKRKAQWADPEWQQQYWNNPEVVARRRANNRVNQARKRVADPDHDKKIRRKYRESRIEWERRDRAENPDKYLDRARKRRIESPHLVKAVKHRRRAKLAAAGSIPYSAEQWAAKVEYWGSKCWMCRKPLDIYCARDHVKPINKGGMDCLSNLRPACKSCNSAKGAKWPFRPEEEICLSS